jgi:hypothetical protein
MKCFRWSSQDYIESAANHDGEVKLTALTAATPIVAP